MSYKLMDLEKFMETKILNKRSTDNIQNKDFQFMEFSPKGLIKYNIVNLNEIWNISDLLKLFSITPKVTF